MMMPKAITTDEWLKAFAEAVQQAPEGSVTTRELAHLLNVSMGRASTFIQRGIADRTIERAGKKDYTSDMNGVTAPVQAYRLVQKGKKGPGASSQ